MTGLPPDGKSAFEPPTGRAAAVYDLAPGVQGYAVEAEGAVYIPMIHAEREGAGDVGRFLDLLSPRCRVANVISARLAGMLVRRGWRPVAELVDDEEIDVWIHPDATPHAPLMPVENVLAAASAAQDAFEAIKSLMAAEARHG